MTTQIERITRVETKVDYLTQTVEDFIDSADKKYASKTTQVIVYGLVAAILYLFFQTNFTPSRQTVTITTQNPDGTTTTKTVPASGGQVVVPAATPGNNSTTTVTQNPPQQESPLAKLPVVGPLFQ